MAQQLKNDIETATLACLKVKGSKKFAKLLEFVLLHGNYMNSGNGSAFGYELSCLAHLKTIKNSDNKQTLLEYAIHTIEKKFPELLTSGEELHELDKVQALP